jgi:hypothetical protein
MRKRVKIAMIRGTIRKAVGVSQTNIKIKIIPDCNDAPSIKGEGWYFTTRGGTRIMHPSAYSKRGWRNMVYQASTRRIEVGVEWVNDKICGELSLENDTMLMMATK